MAHTYQRQSITSELARTLIAGAEERARQLGMAIAVTVVDESGILKAYARMDGAPLVAEGASRKKALTAVGFGLATGAAWYEMIHRDPILLLGAPQLDDFILLGGGVPVSVDGQLVGAIGVSGGHYQQDEDCARSALQAAGLGSPG
ncbi:MAG: heme-binding protein [Myxococcota bacterium]